MGKTDMVVQRRVGLLGLVAVSSAALAAAYLVLYGVDGAGSSLLVACVLGAISVVHIGATWAACHPLLVADAVGIRVRLGGAWTGLPWDAVERVELEDRARLRDGRITIVAGPGGGDGATAFPARLVMALNRRVYGSPLTVSYGVTTTVSVVDIATTLERLSAGKTEVVRLDEPVAAPEPTVEILDRPAPAKRRVSAAAAGQPARSRPIAARLVRPATRRDEIAVATHTAHATMGGLALSEPDLGAETVALPEIEQLRRQPETADDPTRDQGNVSLIIDATTDMSARAMQRVRRLDRSAAAAAQPVVADDDTPPASEAVIGREIAAARTRLGMSVDELAERTRIRPYVIESIEADEFGPCGGDFYARGHLRMLARVLGIDPVPLLTGYDELFATSPVNAREVFEVELAAGRSGFVRGGERSANWAVLVAVVLMLALVWGVAKFVAENSDGATPAPTTNTDAAGLGSPGPGTPPAPRMADVRVAAVGGDSRVVVRDRFKQVIFSGLLADGTSKRLDGEAPLRVVAADGGVIALSSSGTKLGVMGEPGMEARQRITSHP